MVRSTSVKAFNEIKENGLLSERRWRVYEILYHHGPLTGAQVAERYRAIWGKTSASETIRNRITELCQMGVASDVGKVVDEHTEMTVILWDVTAKLPAKPEKRPSKNEIIKSLMAENEALRREIARLNSQTKREFPMPPQEQLAFRV